MIFSVSLIVLTLILYQNIEIAKIILMKVYWLNIYLYYFLVIFN